MKRKLGPLQLWQWLAIGIALGLGTYLYRRGHPAAAAIGATPDEAAFNPIDPTTGLPFAAGGAGGGNPTVATAQPSLADLITGMEQIQGLMSGLQSLKPDAAETDVGPAVDTSKDTPATQTGAKPAPKKKSRKPPSTAHLLAELRKPHSKAHQARVRAMLTARGVKIPKTHHGGHKNPGHHTTHHSGGKKSPHSSAPHNPRQHHHVAPPAHQRHHPTKHHRRHR